MKPGREVTFDLYVANPVRQPHADPSIPGISFASRGLIQLALPLQDARRLLQVARQGRANVYLIPVAYRSPSLTIAQARSIALERHAALVAAGDRLAQLDEGKDDFLWWTFCADDLDAQERDLYPGRVCIAIDKLDGHIRSAEEFNEWLQLSADTEASR